MKHLTTGLAVLSLLLLLPCSVQAEDFRIMRHPGAFPPYYFEESDPRTGIVKDIFAALTQETGDTAQYVVAPFKRAIFMFESGEIDIEPMANPDWRKSPYVDGEYSIPYTTSEEVLLFRSGREFRFKGPDDLQGKTVGVVAGYEYPAFTSHFSEGTIRPHFLKNEDELIKLLLAGRIDQAFMNKKFAQYQIKTRRLGDELVVGDVFSSKDIMIRFHPSRKAAIPRFNKAIRKLKGNGTIDRILNKYR